MATKPNLGWSKNTRSNSGERVMRKDEDGMREGRRERGVGCRKPSHLRLAFNEFGVEVSNGPLVSNGAGGGFPLSCVT